MARTLPPALLALAALASVLPVTQVSPRSRGHTNGHVLAAHAIQRDASARALPARGKIAGGAPASATAPGAVTPGAVVAAVDGRTGYAVLAGDEGNSGRAGILDMAAGAILATTPLAGVVSTGGEFTPPSILALDERAGHAFVTTITFRQGAAVAGHVDVLHARTAAHVGALTTRGAVTALAVDEGRDRVFVVDGSAYGSTSRGRVVVLDARTGGVVREVLIDRGPTAVAVDERSGHAFVAAQGRDKTTNEPVGEGSVSMLDTASGAVPRTVAVPGAPAALAVDPAGGRALVLSAANTPPYTSSVSTLDAASGALLRSVDIGQGYTAAALTVDAREGRAFALVASPRYRFGGRVSVLDTRGGAVVRAVDLRDEPRAIAVDARRGRAFVATERRDGAGNYTGPGGVVMLDARGGSILRTLAIGKNPSSIAVDERRGLVYVASTGPVDPNRADQPTGPGALSILDARDGALLRTVPAGVSPVVAAVDEGQGRVLVRDSRGVTTLPAGGVPGSAPSGTPSGASLVLAVPGTARDLYTRDGPVQLYLRPAAAASPAPTASRPLYRPLPTSDLDVSADGRLLAYGDAAYRLHVARLAADGTGAGTDDRVIGRGVGPRFSRDGRYLAFVTSDTLPLPGSPERLVVYSLATGRASRAGPAVLPRVGAAFTGPLSLFAWAPRANLLAWQPSPDRPSAAIFDADHPATPRTSTIPLGRIAGGLSWGADGASLLFWRFASTTMTQGGAYVPNYTLVRWPLPDGPAATIVGPAPTAWSEGATPAPATDARGDLFASLLGAPGDFNRVVLYGPGQPPRSIALPGEPRLARFAPTGARFVTVWTPPYGHGIASHAALVDPATGRVRDLGPVLDAFWIGAP